jgi:hypothetical protein
MYFMLFQITVLQQNLLQSILPFDIQITLCSFLVDIIYIFYYSLTLLGS